MKKIIKIVLLFSFLIFIPVFLIWLGIYLEDLNTVRLDIRLSISKDWEHKIAYKYAPIFFQVTDNKNYKYDCITSLNFDGDWSAFNNIENLEKDKIGKTLKPVIYYFLVESKSHFIITYSIFHPMDWNYREDIIEKIYENDMKHVQIIVKKRKKNSIDGKVCLVALSAGDKVKFYHNQFSPFKYFEKLEIKEEKFILLNDKGEIDENGTHIGIVIDTQRHGLYLPQLKNDVFLDSKNLKLKSGIKYIPSFNKKEDNFPNKNNIELKYALGDTYESMWKPMKKNSNIKLFYRDFFNYEDLLFKFKDVPRYFNGDEKGSKSPLPNPNCTPFAFGLKESRLGSYSPFFNPIEFYRTYFYLKGWWSFVYLYYPYEEY